MTVSLTPIKLVPIPVKNNESIRIYMSRYLMKHLQIDENQDLRICLGKKYATGKVYGDDIVQNECHLSETIIAGLSLPMGTYKWQCIQARQTLYLGPVAALLAELPRKDSSDLHFGTIHNFCGELNTRISEVGGFFYVFDVSGFSSEGISGYYFDNGRWVKAVLPVPDCIYNRIHSRRFEHKPLFKNFRNELEQLKIPLFNDHYLAKWEVYQQLCKNEQILPYVPETQMFTKKNLQELLAKYHRVFIKPDHGSQGRNIIKIAKVADQVSLQASQSPESAVIIKKDSIDEVLERLTPLLQKRMYIIQQGISLLEYQNRSMDFRVLVHKNGRKVWKVASLVARISAEQQFVSNIAKGGTIIKPAAALSGHFNRQTVLEMLSLLKELSLEAAATVSEHTSGMVGELGIDIGIDQKGKPWIIEINSKPSKNFEDSLKVRPSAKAIIQFCECLFSERTLEKEG